MDILGSIEQKIPYESMGCAFGWIALDGQKQQRE
jgi:hypothetical protein